MEHSNNIDACCRVLAQESNKYLYMEYHSPDDTRMNRNRLLHINLGIHPHASYHGGDGAQLNGGRTLVHSSSDGHIDPQRTTAILMGILALCILDKHLKVLQDDRLLHKIHNGTQRHKVQSHIIVHIRYLFIHINRTISLLSILQNSPRFLSHLFDHHLLLSAPLRLVHLSIKFNLPS
ncbi:UNVERIFIED_CONTAM: hypothetical protein K2H54_050644 [Gekko kuhli]